MSVIYDPKTYEPAQSLGRTITRVKVAMMEALDHELEPFDITAAQYVVLVTLAGGEATSASDLCKGISYDPGAMTRMIDRLEQKGLIRRVQRPDDRRKVNLELTSEGKSLYPRMRASAANVQNRLLRGFSKAEVRELEAYLKRMLANA
jgi:DNA-binding MarR family transcriptional regulator